jgi:hypothetical protein
MINGGRLVESRNSKASLAHEASICCTQDTFKLSIKKHVVRQIILARQAREPIQTGRINVPGIGTVRCKIAY